MDSFAEIAEGYDLLAVTRGTDRYADVIANVPRGAGRVLDAGCGTGVLAAHLARGAGLVVGLDVSPSMLALARRRCLESDVRNVTLVFGTLERAPFPDHAFDVVVCSYVLQRARLDRALPALSRLVRPGGRIVIVALVSSWPRLHDLRVARLWSIAFATPGLVRRHGARRAGRVLAYRVRRAWRGPWGEGLMRTPDGFREECSHWLPGARALPPRWGAITIVWDAPA